MTERIERTEDLYLINMDNVPPAEEGQVRQANGDILAFIGGQVKSLTAGGSGLTYIEFLLDNEPIAETGVTDCSYTPHYTSGKLDKEEWFRNDATLIKSIDYTYTGAWVTKEVRKVFAANGVTIVAQVTWNYSYTGGKITSATMTRDV